MRVGNNPFDTVMRSACGFLLALWLSFSASGQTPVAPTPAPTTKKPAAPAQKANKEPSSASPTSKPRNSASVSPPHKVVVREGGAREPAAQIVPGMTPAEAERERRNAEQWLNSTGDQLKQLSVRELQPPQQGTVEQIRNYMDGARSALREGDVRRATILAEKAHLLAEDLTNH